MGSRVKAVVQIAARRRFTVVALEQLGFAIAPVLAGFILLLLLGTQILSVYWLVCLAAVGTAIVVTRVRKRNLSRYETAQILDHQLRLEDSLSTAWFLIDSGKAGDSQAARYQIEQADSLAATVAPKAAFPLLWHRAWTLSVAFAAVAFGLFAVRYLVTNSLSIKTSLVPVQITPVFEALQNRLNTTGKLPGESGNNDRSQATSNENGAQLPEQKDANSPQDEQGGQSGTQEAVGPGKSQAESGKPADAETGDKQGNSGQGSDNKAESQQDAQQGATEKTGQNEEGKRQGATGQQNPQGLMDKMKDALSSLMAKMQNSGQQPQQNGRPSDDNKTGSQSSNKGQQQDAQNRGANQDQSAEGQSQAQASERSQGAQGRSSDTQPEKGADAHSGIGRQDGDKNVKEAEQLAAMGKLAEIIGKRSAALTGDMTVETQSGKGQQLKTQYSQKLARHTDSGGEINRDEIPVEDQEYVREYMNLVHKQAKVTGK